MLEQLVRVKGCIWDPKVSYMTMNLSVGIDFLQASRKCTTPLVELPPLLMECAVRSQTTFSPLCYPQINISIVRVRGVLENGHTAGIAFDWSAHLFKISNVFQVWFEA